MPKAKLRLEWSPIQQRYCLSEHETELQMELDTAVWHSWLDEQVNSFAFRGQKGSYTARKEQIKAGDWYWYAYQRSRGHLRKKYLGKSWTLTLQRLEEVAESFEQARTANQPSAPSSPDGHQTLKKPQSTRQPEEVIVLTRKLQPPLVPVHLVKRQRLLAQLQTVQDRSVICICAPAGFGKSTLLSNWLSECTLPATWLSLEPEDNQPVRFWSYLFTAIDKLYPGVGKHTLTLLQSLQSPNIERLLTLLLNLLEEGEQGRGEATSHALLVIDDFHVISDQAIQQGIGFLLSHLPTHLHVVIATRSLPSLPLARLRVAGRLLELQAGDLRFTLEETALFFAQQNKRPLSAEEIALLEKRMEGWAAGLQLVALLLQNQSQHHTVLEQISGREQAFTEYLGQEVLARLPEEIQQFLLRTAILEKLEGELCEAVSGLPGGKEILNWLYQANLFLTPLDEDRRWYRYHQIFVEMLRHLAQQHMHIPITELHRRAARWYREQGMLPEAIGHAHQAQDMEIITNIVEEVGVDLISRGEAMMIMTWVGILPRAVTFARLRLFLYVCWMHWYSGHVAIVTEMLQQYIQQHNLPDLDISDPNRLEREICAHVNRIYPDGSYELRANQIAELLVLYGLLTMQQPERAAFSQTVCKRAIIHVAELAHRARIAQHLSTVSLFHNDLATATSALEEGLFAAIIDGSATWVSAIGSRLIMLYAMLGQLQKITNTAQEILQVATGKALLTQGTAYIFLGSVEYERNNLDTAEQYFKLALDLGKEVNLLNDVTPSIHFLLGYLNLARIELLRGKRSQAKQYLEEVQNQFTDQWMGAEAVPVAKGEYALLLHEMGEKSAGNRWLEEFTPSEDSRLIMRQYISLNHSHDLIYVKLLLAHHRFREAEKILQEQLAPAEEQKRIGSLIQWQSLHALLNQAQGQTEQAISALAYALYLAEHRGYIRAFLDWGTPLRQLLQHLHIRLQKGDRPGKLVPTPNFTQQLLQLFSEDEQRHGNQKIELSKREIEVLKLLGKGRANRQIAEELVITASTVKSHLRAIYTKLGTESRTQALIEARKHGLL